MRVELDELPQQVRPSISYPINGGIYTLTGDSWAPALCALLAAATQSVDVAAYSITTRWSESPNHCGNVVAAMVGAAARGIRCRALVADHKKTAATSHFNRHARTLLSGANWEVRRAQRAHLLHAKLWLIDKSATIVGSHNITRSASDSNIDLSLCVMDETFNQQMRDLFNNWWRVGLQN